MEEEYGNAEQREATPEDPVLAARMERIQDDEEDCRGVLERKAENTRVELELKREIGAKFLARLLKPEGPGDSSMAQRAPAADLVAAFRVEALDRRFSDGEADSDSDESDDSEESSLDIRDPPIVYTLCPISRRRLRFPVRSIKCDHGDCIDLESFLATSVRRVRDHEPYLKAKRCIVCGDEVDSLDLVLDLWVKGIVDEVFASPENRNVTRVNVNEDGTWSLPRQVDNVAVLDVDVDDDRTTQIRSTAVHLISEDEEDEEDETKDVFPSSWTCLRCTVQNPVAKSSCEVCDADLEGNLPSLPFETTEAPSPAAAGVQVKPAATGWHCPCCEIPNLDTSENCIGCDFRRRDRRRAAGALKREQPDTEVMPQSEPKQERGSEGRGPERGWTCPGCRVPNLAGVWTCVGCGYRVQGSESVKPEPSDDGDARGTPEADSWVCDTCTFINSPIILCCEVCTEKRTGVTPAMELPYAFGAAEVEVPAQQQQQQQRTSSPDQRGRRKRSRSHEGRLELQQSVYKGVGGDSV